MLPRNVFCVSSSSDKTFAKNAIHLVLRDEPITTVHAKNKLIFPKVLDSFYKLWPNHVVLYFQNRPSLDIIIKTIVSSHF